MYIGMKSIRRVLQRNPNDRSSKLEKTLCMSIIGSPRIFFTMQKNVMAMEKSCDWLFFTYNPGEAKKFKNGTDELKKRGYNIRMIDVSQQSTVKTFIFYNYRNLGILEEYDHVFFMDEDISILGWNLHHYMDVLKCNYGHIPLISQPMTFKDESRHFAINRYSSFESTANLTISSIHSNFVEVNVFLMKRDYFQYYFGKVFLHEEASTCCGVDISWCGPPIYRYIKQMKLPHDTVACSIVHYFNVVHQNMRTLTSKDGYLSRCGGDIALYHNKNLTINDGIINSITFVNTTYLECYNRHD
eukprot:TRINITY_DN4957_c0_g1_i2.p1 TRINITY_DN4957_c0_g1~~TRINITY_DN4957_c0_g1_i2.p1  ORF type:complete len:300 (-),score=35.82 TRINITY_DN4957_c0_g1_i2:234-1133(-)